MGEKGTHDYPFCIKQLLELTFEHTTKKQQMDIDRWRSMKKQWDIFNHSSLLLKHVIVSPTISLDPSPIFKCHSICFLSLPPYVLNMLKKIKNKKNPTSSGPTQPFFPPVKSAFCSFSSTEMAYGSTSKVTSELFLPSVVGWPHTLPSWKPPVLQLSETPYASCFPPFPCHDTLPHLQLPFTNSAI